MPVAVAMVSTVALVVSSSSCAWRMRWVWSHCSGGLAGGGEDVSVVDVEDVGIDGGRWVAPGQFPGVGPVCGGAPAVEQSCRAQNEGARAQGGHAGPGRMSGAHRVDQFAGRFAIR